MTFSDSKTIASVGGEREKTKQRASKKQHSSVGRAVGQETLVCWDFCCDFGQTQRQLSVSQIAGHGVC